MPIPPHLNQVAYHLEVPAVANAAAIVTAIDTAILAIGWTYNGGTGYYKSPVDAYGRFVEISFDSSGGTNLKATLKDHLGRSYVAGSRINVTAGHNIEIWYSSFYIIILNRGNDHYMTIQKLVLDPEDGDAHLNDMVFSKTLQHDGASDNLTVRQWFAYSVEASAYNVATPVVAIFETASLGAGTFACGMTPIGAREWWPMLVFGNDGTGVVRYRGKIPNMVLVKNSLVAAYQKIPISINEGDTRTFRVLPITATLGARCAIRED